jgi:F-type H+-transporting ATPase subunit delta
VEREVSEDMTMIIRALHQSPELVTFTRDSVLSDDARHRVLESLFKGRVHEMTWTFLQFLESKRRLHVMGKIGASFQELDDKRRGVIHGEMSSSAPVDASALEAMASRFSALLGKTVLLRAKDDPSLLGGCRVQVGDIVYDFSLAARLRMAHRVLAGT